MSETYRILKHCYKYYQRALKTGKMEYPTRKDVESKFGEFLLSELIYYDYIEELGDRGKSHLKITLPGIQEYHRIRRDFTLAVIAVASLVAAFYPILSDVLPMIQSLLSEPCFQV